MRTFILSCLLIACFLTATSQAVKPFYKNGEEVINAMYSAYKGDKWYKNFTFSQETHFFKDGKEEKMEVWHEAAAFPGNLLIKFGSKDARNGLLFANHQLTVFSEGKEPVARPMINELLVAGFDVYFLKPKETAHIFDSLGYNLDIAREDVFDGRKVIVVGAVKDDSTSRQFWIDADRLYLHRIIYTKGKTVSDCIFSDYKKIENYWVAKKIIFKQNGKTTTVENYFDIQFPKEINS